MHLEHGLQLVVAEIIDIQRVVEGDPLHDLALDARPVRQML